MPSIQETAYPRFKSTLSPKELAAIYTPTPGELDFAKQVTTASHATRLGFVILLKTFQRLGYAVSTREIPPSIVQHLAAVTQLHASKRALEQYDAVVQRMKTTWGGGSSMHFSRAF